MKRIILLAAMVLCLTGCTRITIGDASYTQIWQGKNFEMQFDPVTGKPIMFKYSSDNAPSMVLIDKLPGMIVP